MAEQKRTIEEQSIDPATQEMLQRAEEMGIHPLRGQMIWLLQHRWCRMCCKNCSMGPCRFTKDGHVGICGATIDTIQARNFLRAISAGASAHSDHGRDMAFTLKAIANGEAEGYVIRDVAKLRTVAGYYNIPVEDVTEEIANDLADLYISQFGQQTGQVAPVFRAPKKRQEIWKEKGVMPRVWTGRLLRLRTGPISVMTRIQRISSSTRCGPHWLMAGVVV